MKTFQQYWDRLGPTIPTDPKIVARNAWTAARKSIPKLTRAECQYIINRLSEGSQRDADRPIFEKLREMSK